MANSPDYLGNPPPARHFQRSRHIQIILGNARNSQSCVNNLGHKAVMNMTKIANEYAKLKIDSAIGSQASGDTGLKI